MTNSVGSIGAGIKLNAPFIGQGDYFQAQVNYTQGALRYVFQTTQPSWTINDSGNSAGFGPIAMPCTVACIGGTGVAAATSLELTTAWNVNAAYEHFWSPRWRTSLYGGYAQVSYGGAAQSLGCGFGTRRCRAPTAATATGSTWWVGSRTQWNVTKDFYMGLDVMYSKLQSATDVDGLRQRSTACALDSIGPPRMHSRRPTRTTGRSASACTATSIPDRVIMDV